MAWPRSNRRTVDPPNLGSPTPAHSVECYGTSLCSFSLGSGNGGDRA